MWRVCLISVSSRRCTLLLWFRETPSAAHEEVISHNKLSPWSQTPLSESLMLLVRCSAVGFGGVARWGLRCLCSGDAAGRYRDTVLLPRTDFPMRMNGPNLLEREIQIQQVTYKWQIQIQIQNLSLLMLLKLRDLIWVVLFCYFINHSNVKWFSICSNVTSRKATQLEVMDEVIFCWCFNFSVLFYRNVVLTSCTHGRERKKLRRSTAFMMDHHMPMETRMLGTLSIRYILDHMHTSHGHMLGFINTKVQKLSLFGRFRPPLKMFESLDILMCIVHTLYNIFAASKHSYNWEIISLLLLYTGKKNTEVWCVQRWDK